MEQHLVEIRDNQKASWNQFSPGWKKWDTLTMDFLQPMGNAMLRYLQPLHQSIILDIAAGTGEPALTIAEQLTNGKVVMTDLSEKMLEVALEKAQKRGIHNVETVVCDVCELPFANLTFDAVTCRFGFMFFPDMQLAASEMLRVLKPGGKLTTTVWGMTEKNSWVTIITNTIQQYMPSPPPKPEAPGMFRCAQQGLLLQLLQNAGLKNGIETAINSVIHCGTAEVFWNMMTEIAAPFAAALNKADADLYQIIKSEVIAQLHQKYTPNAVMIHTSAWVISGTK